MPSSNPLTPEQLQFLQQEVVREATRTLAARRFRGIYGPLGAGIESVALEEYGPDRDAEIELEGKHDPDPIVAVREKYVRIPILYKDFIVHWRDVELSRKLGQRGFTADAVRITHQRQRPPFHMRQDRRRNLEVVLDQLRLDDMVIGKKRFRQVRQFDLAFADLGHLRCA